MIPKKTSDQRHIVASASITIERLLVLYEAKQLIVFFSSSINDDAILHRLVVDNQFPDYAIQNKVELFSESMEFCRNSVKTKHRFYTINLNDVTETTVFVAQRPDGSLISEAYIIDQHQSVSISNHVDGENLSPFATELKLTDSFPVIKGKRGESCFSRSDGRDYFLMAGFTHREAFKITAAMRYVSKSLCSKLEAFESALPEGVGGLVWNLRKSQNIEPLGVKNNPEAQCPGKCGCAQLERGERTHSINFSLSNDHVRKSTIMGIAITIIHEMAHQFGVRHGGELNAYDFEGALWASHNETVVRRSQIARYMRKARALVLC